MVLGAKAFSTWMGRRIFVKLGNSSWSTTECILFRVLQNLLVDYAAYVCCIISVFNVSDWLRTKDSQMKLKFFCNFIEKNILSLLTTKNMSMMTSQLVLDCCLTVNTHTHTQKNTHTSAHTQKHTHTHIYIYIYIHTFTTKCICCTSDEYSRDMIQTLAYLYK